MSFAAKCSVFVLLLLAIVVVAELDDPARSDYYFKHRRNRNHRYRNELELEETAGGSGEANDTSYLKVVGPSNPGANCYDSRLTSFINTGIQHYTHDMGALSKYILDQIVRTRYSGSWLVHAEMIQTQRQGLEWQSVTNGDLFQSSSRHGCYYHDTQTYLIVIRY